MTAFGIEKLARHHRIDVFDCNDSALNGFLLRFALTSQQAHAAQTYVGLADEEVIGYYTLVVAQVACREAPERLTRGLARHPVPLMLLARLAVAKDWQGRGIGAGLLKDAMRRTLQAADIAGIRAFAAHAKDEVASAFYRHFDFLPSATDPRHFYLLVKDLRHALAPRL